MALEPLKPQLIREGTVLFRPGDMPAGFVLTVSGRVNVYLNSRTGRELLLYSIEPGETCVQTTLGMLGAQPYSGEAIAETDVVAVTVPPAIFDRLLTGSETFRRFVFRAFADRLGEMTHLLEMVAFVKVERRLAQWLLAQAGEDGAVRATHAEIASAIGSAREVVSRRLEALAGRGIVRLERGVVRIESARGLRQIAGEEAT
ncbi:Crp/Fnr family transcriptional regulator [Oricola thermophila]|uniref:Crp/Fnr family transcriptional regulator n=2 Tax=Oricola thermophila TaxID=2742145 RepID=A0A6N1VHV4_9HYPH|nr:Crp/Fnr family transcriptional regulator [Oricola thermophila]